MLAFRSFNAVCDPSTVFFPHRVIVVVGSLDGAQASLLVQCWQGSELAVLAVSRHRGLCVQVPMFERPLGTLGWIAIAAPLFWSAPLPPHRVIVAAGSPDGAESWFPVHCLQGSEPAVLVLSRNFEVYARVSALEQPLGAAGWLAVATLLFGPAIGPCAASAAVQHQKDVLSEGLAG